MNSLYRVASRHLPIFSVKQVRGAKTLNSSLFKRRTMTPSTNFMAASLNADFIPSLRKPTQQVLWIGCSDSCFQETTILDLLPEEMLVHRNLGNMLVEGDMSSEITVKHAVSALQVKHIVVCGHYGCGIVRAESRDGLKGPWLSHLNSLHSTFKGTIDQLPAKDRDRAFVELNVLAQLRSLRGFDEVAEAMKTRDLQLHGIVYDAQSGEASRLLDGYETKNRCASRTSACLVDTRSGIEE